MKSATLRLADVRKAIKAGQTAPIYLLEGDDPQSRHGLALEFASVVDEALQAFNVESFYASEATSAGARDALIAAILGAARTLPMMAPRRVILVHEAERLLSPRRSKEDDSDAQPELPAGPRRKRPPSPAEELEAYVECPEPMSTLVFVAGALDANRRLVKLVRAHGVTVDCGSLETLEEAAAWVQKRLEQDELTIDPKALALLIEATGHSLGRLRAEVEKLVLYVSGEAAVTARHVRDLVLPSDEPSEGPAVGFAVRDGDARRALKELAALFEAGLVAPMVLGQIRWGVTQLRPDTRVRPALELVLRTDLALKSSAGDPRFLLERLVVELCAR